MDNLRKLAGLVTVTILAGLAIFFLPTLFVAGETKYYSGPIESLGGIEIELTLDTMDNPPAIELEFFSPVFWGFEARAGRAEAKLLSYEEKRSMISPISFEFEHGETTWQYNGYIMGDVIDGDLLKLTGERSTHEIRFISAEPGERDGRLPGQYRNEAGHTLLLTYREFGAYRLIDVANSQTTTLFSVGERTLMPANVVNDLLSDETSYRFFQSQDGDKIDAMNFNPEGDRRTTYYKLEGLREDLITIETEAGPTRASILLPKGDGPHPAVIFVSGSGPIYRTALSARAATLQEAGMAVVVYDKRGTGTFGTGWTDPPISALASDLTAVFETVSAHPAINADQIGLAGHSNATYVIPEAIGNGLKEVAFVILISSSGNRPAAQTLFDKRHDLVDAGYSESEVKAALSLLDRVHKFVLSMGESEELDALSADFLNAQNKPWFDFLDLPRLSAMPTLDTHPDVLQAYYDELSFDPLANVSHLTMPLLLLNGTEDSTSDAINSQRAWSEAMAGLNTKFDMVMVEGAEHGLRDENGLYVPEYWASQLEWLRDIGILP